MLWVRKNPWLSEFSDSIESKLWVPPLIPWITKMNHWSISFRNSQNPEYTYSPFLAQKVAPKVVNHQRNQQQLLCLFLLWRHVTCPNKMKQFKNKRQTKDAPPPQIVINSKPTDNFGSNMVSPSISMEASLFQPHLGNIFNSLEISPPEISTTNLQYPLPKLKNLWHSTIPLGY